MMQHERTCDENSSTVGLGVPLTSEIHQTDRHHHDDEPMELIEQAHRGKLCVYRKIMNISDVHSTIYKTIMNECNNIILSQHNHVKWNITVKIVFQKETRPDVFTDPPIYLKTSPIATTNTIPLKNSLLGAVNILEGSIDNFISNGSGWRVYTLQAVDLNIANYNPLNASSYLKLPIKHEHSKSNLNIQNNDKKCFVWSILAKLHPVDRRNNPHFVHHYTVV